MELHKRPIVCWAAIDWEYLFQRPHQLMQCFARAGHPVFYRNPNQVVGSRSDEVEPNLVVYRDDAQLASEIRDVAIHIVYNPLYASLIEPGADKFIIYDCADDFPDFTPNEPQMLEKADLVICCSVALMEKHQGRHPRILFLPNGVDVELFRPRNEALPDEIRIIRQQQNLIIGFSGAMYQQRVDVDLLYALAKANSNWSIVVIGETYGWDFRGAPDNLMVLGRKSYQELPVYLRGLDLGLIPFLDNQIARGTDPIKLYEYLAAGLPVVSRRLPFLNNLPTQLVASFDTHEQAVAVITEVINLEVAQKEILVKQRLKFAVANSWLNRFERLVVELNLLTWL